MWKTNQRKYELQLEEVLMDRCVLRKQLEEIEVKVESLRSNIAQCDYLGQHPMAFVLSEIFIEDGIVAICESYLAFRYCVRCKRFGPSVCLHCDSIGNSHISLCSAVVTCNKISESLLHIHFSNANDLDVWNYFCQNQVYRVDVRPEEFAGTHPSWRLEYEQFDTVLYIQLWKSSWTHASVCKPNCMKEVDIFDENPSECYASGRVVLTVYIEVSDFHKSVHHTVH